jgi:hypothetical protein
MILICNKLPKMINRCQRRNQPMLYVLKRSLQHSYAGVQFVSDSIELGTSIYFESSSLALATSVGLASGVLSYVTTLYFQCREIDDYFETHYGLKDSQPEQNFSSLPLAWLYTCGRSLQKVGDNYFQMQAILASYQALRLNQSLRLQRLPTPIFLSVMAYTVVCNLPFMLSNEMQLSCEQIAPEASDQGRLPTERLLTPLTCLNSRWLNQGAVWLGVLSHCCESLTSMLMMIPPSTWFKLAQCGQFYFLLGYSGLGGIALLFFSVHLVHTLFFEGHYSKQNLNRLSEAEIPEPEISNHLQYYGLKWSTQLLWTQSLLHGLDDALPITALLATLGFGPTAYIAGGVATLISFFGTQTSEVYRAKIESRHVLARYEEQVVNNLSPQLI